jgi:transposase InsO family protein
LEAYITANPELRERTIKDYRKRLESGLEAQMDQSAARLTRETILRLNRERHEEMAKKDPIHKPPRGFYGWQGSLRVLRTVLNWQAAQDNRDSSVRRRKRKRIGAVERKPLPKPVAANLSWSMDFVSDGLADGRRLRCLTVVDDCTRECLAIEVDTSITGTRVKHVMDSTGRGTRITAINYRRQRT